MTSSESSAIAATLKCVASMATNYRVSHSMACLSKQEISGQERSALGVQVLDLESKVIQSFVPSIWKDKK